MGMSLYEKYFSDLEELVIFNEAGKTSLIVSQEQLKFYQEQADVLVNDKKISSELLKELLINDYCYKYVEMLFFDKKIEHYTVNCIVNLKESENPIILSKADIAKGIQKCIEEKLLVLDEKGEKRLAEIFRVVDFKLFFDEFKDKVFYCLIDGEKFEVGISDIMDFLNYSDRDYEEFFDLDKEGEIFGIPKDKFAYIVVEFFKYFDKNFDIFSEYSIPDEMIRRYKDLESSKRIDIDAFDKIKETYAPNLEKVKVDCDLRREILNGLPEDVSDLEKCIYVYIKMCKLLVYDESFFALNQSDKALKKYQDINYLNKINLYNNKVVCYIFNAIYAKIINDLGVKFEMNVNPLVEFGGGHANLMFRDGKFLVQADAVASIFNGDLTRAKLNQELNGLVCLNKNENTQEEFKEKVLKIYKLVVEQENEKRGEKAEAVVGNVETFDDIVSKYRKLSIIKRVSLEEKFQIMMDKASKTELYKIDFFAYCLQLKKIIFNKEEQQKNIAISIVKKSVGGYASANAVFSMNETDFDSNPEETIYYIHDGFNWRISSKEELETWFEDGRFEYIDGKERRIPGIVTDGHRRRK